MTDRPEDLPLGLPLSRREVGLIGSAAWRDWVDETPAEQLETPEGHASLDAKVKAALQARLLRDAMEQPQALYGDDGARLILDERGRVVGSSGLPADWRQRQPGPTNSSNPQAHD